MKDGWINGMLHIEIRPTGNCVICDKNQDSPVVIIDHDDGCLPICVNHVPLFIQEVIRLIKEVSP